MNFKTGIVSEIKPGYAKVYFEEDQLVTDWWPVLVRTSMTDKESWPLNIKEHVVCLIDKYCEEGVVLGAIHSKPEPPDSGAGPGKFRKVFEDGTILEYDKSSHKLTADVKGEVKIKSSGKIDAEGQSIECSVSGAAKIKASSIDLEGPVSITGTLNVSGIATIAGALSAAGISATGGASITSTGNIETSGELKGASVKAGDIDLASHKHSGVTTGGGVSGPAVP